MKRDPLLHQSDSAYFAAYEAGALAALDHVTDERPDLEDVTMRAAEKIGASIAARREAGLR